MSATSVGTAPVRLPARIGDRPVVQNLGPGDIYVNTRADVTTSDGLKIPVDQAYEWPGDLAADLYAISTLDDTDVRVIVVG